MNEAGGQRETLLPSAGQLAGELLFALRQAELLDAFSALFARRFFTLIHARDEIEIFLDAQILPKTESLRHVTDFALDRFALGDHVVTENTCRFRRPPGAIRKACAKTWSCRCRSGRGIRKFRRRAPLDRHDRPR